jgi:hypothetical protein
VFLPRRSHVCPVIAMLFILAVRIYVEVGGTGSQSWKRAIS